MSKYLQLFSLLWQNRTTYLFDFVVWRFRQFLIAFMAMNIWSVIFEHTNSLADYTKPQMLGYIFLMSLLQSLILSSSLHGLAGTIYSGELSLDLIKPYNIFIKFFCSDIADKLMNILFAIAEMSLIFYLFKIEIFYPSWPRLIIFVVWCFLGLTIYFLSNLAFATLGFWSNDVWGPKFLFFVFLDFAAGRLYPLDIFPKFVQLVYYLTPFPYLTYVQTQLFLNRFDLKEIVQISLTMMVWLILLYFFNQKLWHKGLKDYVAHGQ